MQSTTAFTGRCAGLRPGRPVVTYCQSGARSSLAAFALELAGFGAVRNYYRSWGEWSAEARAPTSRP